MVTIYLMDFNSGENPFINNSYAVYSKYTGDKVPPNSYTYRTFASTATVSKYTKSGAASSFTPASIATNEDYFSDTQDEMAVFLLRKSGLTGTATTVVDFVTSVKTGGSQTTKIGYINGSLDSLPVLVHGGISFDLRPVLVSRAKHVNENLGQSSYNLRLENCIPVWYKDPRTPTYGQFTDNVPTWDAFSFYYLSTGTRTISNIIEHYTFSTSGVIPQTSLSYVSLYSRPPISSSFECYLNLRYLINADISNVRLTLYTDLNNNHIIDAGDAIIAGYDSIVPSTLPALTYDAETYYKMNFQLTRVSMSGTSFYPVLIKTAYAISNGSCVFNTFEEILFADIQALPVLLGNFAVQYREPSVSIKWETLSETNNRGFEIFRAIGNTDRWNPIAFVGTKAKDGNSSTPIAYQFEDLDIMPGTPHYYRLHQIDFDGKATWGPIRSIKITEADTELKVYPNPVKGDATIHYTGSAPAILYCINENGQVIRQLQITTGVNKLMRLPQGNYILKLIDNETGKSTEKKLIVQE